MNCPKCKERFEDVEFAGVVVQRCVACRGIWFDHAKQVYLKDIDGSESIDIGEAKVGKKNNQIANYNCPDCANPMVKMVDPDQPHIWFESCARCFGVYFDAGEFSDYKDKSVLDFVRAVFSPERR
ncbi:MAG: zf-TFIIB domain-containing protein [Gammaproteobacteria bacterium]